MWSALRRAWSTASLAQLLSKRLSEMGHDTLVYFVSITKTPPGPTITATMATPASTVFHAIVAHASPSAMRCRRRRSGLADWICTALRLPDRESTVQHAELAVMRGVLPQRRRPEAS